MNNRKTWRRIIGFFKKIMRGDTTLGAMVGDPHFWLSFGIVLIIAVSHSLLEELARLTNIPIDFLPISFFWVPVIYVALKFGFTGAVITSSVVVLLSVINWISMSNANRRWEEITIVIATAVLSFVLGRQVDRKTEAQKNATTFAAKAVRSQEEERKKLSLELHDDSIQTLIAICHKLNTPIT